MLNWSIYKENYILFRMCAFRSNLKLPSEMWRCILYMLCDDRKDFIDIPSIFNQNLEVIVIESDSELRLNNSNFTDDLSNVDYVAESSSHKDFRSDYLQS